MTRAARPPLSPRPPRAHPSRRLLATLTLGALVASLGCRTPRNEAGEEIDLREAQPREALEVTPAEKQRNARFDDMRQRRPRLASPPE